MPHGKPAGVACIQLDESLRCKLFGKPERPSVCTTLRPMEDMCRASASAALAWLTELELATAPLAA
jgi:hypothetical protein